MITIGDIQIFIATHNRAYYLKDSIKSILNQTVGVQEIIVLDNESTDDTEEVVKSFSARGVKYIKTYGFLGNYNKCKILASKKYCMLFHDDNILHPKYLEIAINLLNKYSDLSVITTRYTEFYKDNLPDIPQEVSEEAYVFEKQQDFAKFLYYKEIVAYAPAIYNTEYFKQCPLEYEKYSKFNDWPFMVKMSEYGKSAILADKRMFFVRKHELQDSNIFINVPNFEQIVNWNLSFKKALKADVNFDEYFNFIFRYKYFCLGLYYTFSNPPYKREKSLIADAKKLGIEKFEGKMTIKEYIKLKFRKINLYVQNKIFSIRNSEDKSHKKLLIFGIKINWEKQVNI